MTAGTSVVLVVQGLVIRNIRIGTAGSRLIGNGKELSESGGGTLPVMQHGRATIGSVTVGNHMVDVVLFTFIDESN